MKATLSAALLLLAACGRTTLPCEATSCAGCCDGYGNCRAGTDDLECGAGARACVICAKGASCRNGLCLGGTAAGAGGGVTGGGAAGGGQSGGGAAGGATVIGARTFVPDALLVVDRSGSMSQPLNPNDPACRGCTTSCPPGCTTRGSAMQSALEQLLTTTPVPGRFGLVVFPTNASCGAPTVASPTLPMSDDEGVLSMAALGTLSQLRSAAFSGGTPTGPALRFAANQSALTADPLREHFLVLVTDGLPNCNPMNPVTCMSPQACQCTIGACSGQNCTLGCLDRQNALDALTEATRRGVRTMVVAFSPEVTGSAPARALFDELALAGGMPLSCDTRNGDECGSGNPCLPDQTCSRKFSNDPSTGARRVREVLRRSGRCRFVLDRPVAQHSGLLVRVNDLPVDRGTGFVAEGDDVVRLTGAVCTQLATGPTALPVTFSLQP